LSQAVQAGRAPGRFERAPHLVFWEMTKACPLACKHCRADAIERPLPGELTTEEGKRLLEDIAQFGKVIVVFTGGDPLMRKDLFELLDYARGLGLITSVAPAPSPMLTREVMRRFKEAGVRYVSISLDGAEPKTHDWLRGFASYKHAINGIKAGLEEGLNVQVNTVVWKGSYPELPRVAKLLKDLGVKVWEVFFLIPVGRGTAELDVPKEAYREVIEFLVEVTRYDMVVRTVEAPFFRRAKLEYSGPNLNNKLIRELRSLLGEPIKEVDKSFVPTMDGSGILFVSYDGQVYPSGFLPLPLGNVRERSIVDIYRNNEVLVKIRGAKLGGKCGTCQFVNVCGGSRARAYAVYGDPLAEDPACPY